MTKINRVITGRLYRYDPVPIDQFDPRVTYVQEDDIVRVVKMPGCPPPNTMGHAHVATPDGKFLGLVHVNSLRPVRE